MTSGYHLNGLLNVFGGHHLAAVTCQRVLKEEEQDHGTGS